MTIGIAIGIAFVLLVVYLGVRSDRMENKAIQAGDSYAFNKRVSALMKDHGYAEERATKAVQRVKESDTHYGSAIAKIDDLLWRSLVFAVLCPLVWVFLPAKTKYSIEYNVSSSNIIIEDMPHNCDFLKAPIGDKGCHFEKDVTVTKDAAGRNSRVYVSWDRKED